MFDLFFNPEDGANKFLYKYTFNALHATASKKKELFILLPVYESMYTVFNHCQITKLDTEGKTILAVSS
jgi:hypothetical protein